MKSYSGGYNAGAKAPVTSYAGGAKPGVGSGSVYNKQPVTAYGAPKVLGSSSKPMGSISGGAPIAKKPDEMTAYQRLLAEREAQKQ